MAKLPWIKKATLRNFKSYKNATFEFSPGVNLIVGPTDSGKSALLTFFEWIYGNNPSGTDFITFGTRIGGGTIELSNGYSVTRERSRDSKINRYIIIDSQGNSQTFTGFGTSVPQEVQEVLGVYQYDIGIPRKYTMGFISQFEPPFLLAETDSKKADILDKICKTDLVEAAINDVISDIIKFERQLITENELLKKEQDKNAEYDFLPKFKSWVINFNVAFEDLNKTEQVLSLAEASYEKLKGYQQAIKKYQKTMSAKLWVDMTEQKFIFLKELQPRIQILQRSVASLEELGVKKAFNEDVKKKSRWAIDFAPSMKILKENHQKVTLLEGHVKAIGVLQDRKKKGETVLKIYFTAIDTLDPLVISIKNTFNTALRTEEHLSLLQVLRTKKEQLEKKITALMHIRKTEGILPQLESEYSRLVDAFKCLEYLDFYKQTKMKQEKVVGIYSIIVSHETILKEIKKTQERISKLEAYAALKNEIERKKKLCNEAAQFFKEEVKRYIETLKKTSECPVCFGKIDETAIQNLYEKYMKGVHEYV